MHSAPLYNEQWDSRTPCVPFKLASLAALFTLGLPDLLVLVILTPKFQPLSHIQHSSLAPLQAMTTRGREREAGIELDQVLRVYAANFQDTFFAPFTIDVELHRLIALCA